jgi:hypothetical protein
VVAAGVMVRRARASADESSREREGRFNCIVGQTPSRPASSRCRKSATPSGRGKRAVEHRSVFARPLSGSRSDRQV